MSHYDKHNLTVSRSIKVFKPAEELYNAWRSPETWKQFPSGVEAIESLDDRRSRWKVHVAGKGIKEWTSEITEDREGQLIAWKTVDGDIFDHEGRVTFSPTPADSGTEVSLQLSTHMCGGRVTNALAKLIRHSPEDYISMTLRNFKDLMETGKVSAREQSGSVRLPENIGPKATMVAMALTVFATLVFLRRRQRNQ